MQIKVALVGIGGYGTQYLRELMNLPSETGVQFVAGIDPMPERSPFYAELKQAGIPIYPDLAAFYQHNSADLVMISAPIHLHAPLSRQAVVHGADVLCEKPVSATLDEARQMLKAEQESGKFIAIGYQWSYADTILALKRDIQAGHFGKPLRFKSLILWPRGHSYYHRNDWAGRIQKDGAWVLDSPVHNATAHYLHNMLFVLGPATNRSARPVSLQAELYRANPIENYDTAALRVTTDQEVDLLFLTAHPILENLDPILEYEFEDAVVKFPGEQHDFVVQYRDGREESYGPPDTSTRSKIWKAIEAARNGQPVVCDVQTALPQLICTLGAQQVGITSFPAPVIKESERNGEKITWVEGLSDVLKTSYKTNCMPFETGDAPWAVQSKPVDLRVLDEGLLEQAE